MKRETRAFGHALFAGAGRSVFRRAVLVLAFFCLCGCGKDEPVVVEQGSAVKAALTPDEVVWNYQPVAVNINLQAAADLNLEDHQAHTVLVCVYQLAKQEGFTGLAGNAEGLVKLLECKPFDDSVKAADRSFIRPGHIVGLAYDRAEGAKHVGLVAGYATLDPARITRLRSIPIARETIGSMWWKQDIYYPGVLHMAVLLGANGLQQLPAEEDGNEDE